MQMTGAPKPIWNNRLVSIDVLRGLSALAVMFEHIHHYFNSVDNGLYRRVGWVLLLPLDYGWIGVPVFVVLSGFCIHLACARRAARGLGFQAQWGNFWLRRFTRLYPPYVAAILLSVGILSILQRTHPGQFDGWTRGLVPDLFCHFFMVHNLFSDYHYGLGNGALWSLGMEEQLYALYAVYLVARRRTSSRNTLAGVVGLTILWGVFYRATQAFPDAFGWASSRGALVWGEWPFRWWFCWVLGAVAAEAHVGVVCLPKWCYRRKAALCLFLVSLAVSETTLGYVRQSRFLSSMTDGELVGQQIWMLAPLCDFLLPLAVFILVNNWVRSESQGMGWRGGFRPLALIGLISYSLYLIHPPLLTALTVVFPLGDTFADVGIRYVLYGPICVALAAIFFLAFERPALRLSRAWARIAWFAHDNEHIRSTRT